MGWKERIQRVVAEAVGQLFKPAEARLESLRKDPVDLGPALHEAVDAAVHRPKGPESGLGK